MENKFKILFDKYKIKPNGIMHVGASVGQECDLYYEAGTKQTIWVEAIPKVFENLKNNIAKHPNAIAYNSCISDVDGKEVEFNIASNNDSSSLFEFGTHKDEHPYVSFVDKLKLTTTTLKTLIEQNNINLLDYNILNMDLQGAELLALRGLEEKIIFFNMVILEVNEKELYKGCALVGEIDEYLSKYDFDGVECQINQHGWGEKVYINKNNFLNYSKDFNEEDYLLKYPDVANAVKNGQFQSGLDHYNIFGKKEGRTI